MTPKKVTIRDVAQAAGCSVASVCYAFSGSGKIREETRQRIFEAAERLGYTPNKAAQSLSRNPRHIGVIMPDSFDEVARLFRNSVIETINSCMWCNLQYTLCGFEWYSAESQRQAMDRLLAMPACDGIIANLNYSMADSIRDGCETINRRGIPVVCLMESNPMLSSICSVEVDAVGVGRAAAGLLFGCGSRRTVVIVGDRMALIHRENETGFRMRANELGLAVLDVGVTHNDSDVAEAVTRDLLNRYEPDGIFVTSYVSAAVCRAIRESGRAGRVRVVGVDVCNSISPVLASGEMVASFYQNQIGQAKTATNLLIDAMFSGGRMTAERRILVKPEIVVPELLSHYVSQA